MKAFKILEAVITVIVTIMNSIRMLVWLLNYMTETKKCIAPLQHYFYCLNFEKSTTVTLENLNIAMLRSIMSSCGTNKWHKRKSRLKGLLSDFFDFQLYNNYKISNKRFFSIIQLFAIPDYFDYAFSSQDEEDPPPDYSYLFTRLYSFLDWPRHHLNPLTLARNGYYYYGVRDFLICFRCKTRCHPRDEGIQHFQRHLLCRCNNNNNQALNASTRQRIRGTQTERGVHISQERSLSLTSGNRSATATSTLAYPEYERKNSREESYRNWPIFHIMNPDELVKAGFFYTGVGDRVQCFCCGLSLEDFHLRDGINDAHTSCPFVQTRASNSAVNAAEDN